MQFSESWLRTLVDPPLSADELAHLLTMSGLEVEECRPVAPDFSGVVVGEIRKVDRHPSADRLVVCEVDAGGEVLRIVCGAPNAAAGMKVACARVGARLSTVGGKPLEIRKAQMRGVESQGMLCSAREVGLSEDHSGLLALPDDARPGQDVRTVLDLDDRVFVIKLTPNRADCLSVLGVAREVSALTRAPLRAPEILPVRASCDATFPVRISDPAGCGRFTGRVIRNVNAAAPTPEWMKRRLERAGQRSISALVDVTNYVMLELGRPLHVYDLRKLRGGIDVRFGRAGETLKLLNEQTVTLDETVLAITDDNGPIGLAGIMGGDGTKAELDTRDVFLEAAFFFPDAIAGRARRYNFASDASHRFERGVDFENSIDGIERVTRLILDICGGEAGPVTDTMARLPERRPVRLRVARARKVLGVPVEGEEIADIFHRLRLPFDRSTESGAESFMVTPPSYRFDLEIEEDLIEEVARVYGYDRIPPIAPVAPAIMVPQRETRRSLHEIRMLLAAAGYQEVVNYSFVEADGELDFAGNADPIRLLNPIASQLAVMRSTLIGGLFGNIRYNLNRKVARVRVFEVGRVFLRAPQAGESAHDVAGVRQPIRIAAAAYGPVAEEQWGMPARPVDFYDVKADLEFLLAPLRAEYRPAPHPALHPGRSARVEIGGETVGWIGEIHPRWQKKYEFNDPIVLFELDAAPLQVRPLARYREVSRFPGVTRDIAIVIPETVPVDVLLGALRAAAPAFVEDISLFDVYRGQGIEEGKKGLAFRVLLQDTQKTLTDSEVDAAVAGLREVLEKEYGAELRK
jgi:phenylalanyl-tRNA synthetase beta chain